MLRRGHLNGVSGMSDARSKNSSTEKGTHRIWNWLLLIPFIGLLWPPLYAKTYPMLFGFPFFYWYQFVWVIGSAVLTGVVYLATHRR